MSTDTAAIAATYFEAWQANDVDRLRAVLAENVTFSGPLAQVEGADAYADSIRPLFAGTDRLVIHKVWVDGDDALTWFDLYVPGAPPAPVANWCHVEDGRITEVRVTFDPRAMLAAAPT